jgi:hypothetical protein
VTGYTLRQRQRTELPRWPDDRRNRVQFVADRDGVGGLQD